MANRVWILGASKPGMVMIDRLLRDCGERVEYATSDPDGRVCVTPAQAYRSVTMPAELRERPMPAGSTWYQVECDISAICPDGDSLVVIDHHRPGDPGYGRPPSEFLPASSIGQVVAELARLGRWGWLIPPHEPVYCDAYRGWGVAPVGQTCADTSHRWHTGYTRESAEQCIADWHAPGQGAFQYGDPLLAALTDEWPHYWMLDGRRIPLDIVLAAAADHYLAAAYRGECPGVDPDALMRWRVETRAAHQGCSVEELLTEVKQARVALREAATIELAGVPVADLRDQSIPELPEAAVRNGVAYLATVKDRDGRRKVVIGGASTPKQVQEFLDSWAPSQGLTDLYGDPARGFAGGYLP